MYRTYFFRSSTDMYSSSICLARSMSAASARMQTDMRGRGTLGSLDDNSQKGSQMGWGLSNALDSSRETLIPLRVVVLQANLQFDGLNEVTLFLAVGFNKEFLDGAPHAWHWKFASTMNSQDFRIVVFRREFICEPHAWFWRRRWRW